MRKGSQLPRKVDTDAGVLPDVPDTKERLKWVREVVLGMSPEALGPELSVSDNTVRRYEEGKRTPPNDYIVEMARYSGVSADWLLFNRRGDSHTTFLVTQLQARLQELLDKAKEPKVLPLERKG